MATSSTRARDTTAGGADRTERISRTVAGLVGAVFTVFGAWAFVAPRAFFDAVATFEPYNAHFVRDIGAFQLGLGAVLLLALVWRDALSVVLAGVGVGAVFHLLGHVVDRDLGGTPATDIPFFTVIAVALVAAAITRVRARPRETDDA